MYVAQNLGLLVLFLPSALAANCGAKAPWDDQTRTQILTQLSDAVILQKCDFVFNGTTKGKALDLFSWTGETQAGPDTSVNLDWCVGAFQNIRDYCIKDQQSLSGWWEYSDDNNNPQLYQLIYAGQDVNTPLDPKLVVSESYAPPLTTLTGRAPKTFTVPLSATITAYDISEYTTQDTAQWSHTVVQGDAPPFRRRRWTKRDETPAPPDLPSDFWPSLIQALGMKTVIYGDTVQLQVATQIVLTENAPHDANAPTSSNPSGSGDGLPPYQHGQPLAVIKEDKNGEAFHEGEDPKLLQTLVDGMLGKGGIVWKAAESAKANRGKPKSGGSKGLGTPGEEGCDPHHEGQDPEHICP
jgi:hypothetical protein